MTDYTEKEGEGAFALHSKIAANENQRRTLLYHNTALLKQMKEQELYKVILGDDTAKWHAYLGQIETMYSRNEVHSLLRIRAKFVDSLGLRFEDIAHIPKSRLVALIPIANETNVQELLGQAGILTNQDFKDVIRAIKGLPTTDDEHEHKFDVYEVCSVCGFKHKQDEVTKPVPSQG